MFTELGFSVKLSGTSSDALYEKGIETMPSESVCYPKLVHGHIQDLVDKGVKLIFYPSLAHENLKTEYSDNTYNCPIVTSYPEVIKNNVDALRKQGIMFLNPFLPLDDEKRMIKRIFDELQMFDVDKKEVKDAVEKAYRELDAFRRDMQREGENALRIIRQKGMKGIVLAGRPYHTDPQINHGIPEMINSLGMAVLTEDSVSHLGRLEAPLRVVNQWAYHARLYMAAKYVATQKDLELVQLNSFGCGLDAVTTDQVQEILNGHSKIYTLLKIDEGNNLGAARIRLRSLKAIMEERERNRYVNKKENEPFKNSFYKGNEKDTYHYCAELSPIHFRFVEEVSGYPDTKRRFFPYKILGPWISV